MTFTVIDARSYVDELSRHIAKAKQRIVLTAMIVLRGPRTDDILEPLLAAVKRGVKVHVLADRFGHALPSRPDYLGVDDFKRVATETQVLFSELEAAGARVSLIGKVGLNPYAGRYHAKITVIDDDVFCFGGINLRDDSYDQIDYMLHTNNNALADKLQYIAEQNSHGLPERDLEIQLDDDNLLLFDAGQKGESIIYDRACQLASQAAKITYISQMAPTGKLAKLMKRAKSVYYANQPAKTGLRPDSVAQWFDQRTNGLENQYEGAVYVHAKVILYELANGKKALISGSHNFSWRGVAFGTKEIALCSYDPQLWRRLHDVVYRVATAA